MNSNSSRALSQLGEFTNNPALTHIPSNPREEEIAIGKNVFNSSKHDSVIAIGGGSAMDGGKSICLTACNYIHLWDFEWEKPAPVLHKNQAFPKLLTIPTTAGFSAASKMGRFIPTMVA